MSEGKLSGKVAVVTGGARGIGRAIAERLLAEGARVAITGRDAASIEAAAAELGAEARGYALDVRDRAEVDGVVARAARELGDGALHILVNNAGVAGHTPVDGEDDALWHEILATNLSGLWYCTRAALRHMQADARVIHLASVLGKFGVPGSSAYCASKHGVIGLARAQAIELAGRGIPVNAVCPGWVDTEMARASMERQAKEAGLTYQAFRAQALAAVPQQRMMAPSEVAALVYFLCLPESRGITGQALSIDGGQTTF